MFRPEFPPRSSSLSPVPPTDHGSHPSPASDAHSGNMATSDRTPFLPPSSSPSSRGRSSLDVGPSASTVKDAQKAATVEKTRQELGKLLSVALQRLRERERPPSAFEVIFAQPSNTQAHRYGLSLYNTANSVRLAVRLANPSGSERQRSHDSRASDAETYVDDEGEEDHMTGGQGAGPAMYSTEQTYQLLTAVRDTLIIEGPTIFSPSP